MKFILPALVILNQISLSAFAAPADFEYCKQELAGGFINETTFNKVLLCQADHPSTYYQKLCFGEFFLNSRSFQARAYSAVQFNEGKPGQWGTTVYEGRSEGEVEHGASWVRFLSDQSVLMGSRNISEMVVDFRRLTVTANSYEKQFFGKRLRGTDTYTCVSER